MRKNRSELSWLKADYEKYGLDLPAKLEHDENHSEGELMSSDEIVEWLRDTEMVFKIIKEKDQIKFEELNKKYLLDIQYLVEIGKIKKESAADLINIDRFED